MDEANQEVDALAITYRLLDRLIGLVGTIVMLAFVLVVGLIVVYVYLSLNPEQFSGAATAAENVRSLLSSIWDEVVPIATAVLRLTAPVLVLLAMFILLGYLGQRGAIPFDLSRITSDLPSVLALVIIGTICILPLAGLGIPDVLNNVALVIVGFYFGKRDTPGRAGSA